MLLTTIKAYNNMFATFYYFLPFVRTLAKLGKRRLASTCLAVRKNNLTTIGRIFMKFYILGF